MRQRIDVEGADNRRIEALEIKDEYILENTRLRIEDRSSRCSSQHSRSISIRGSRDFFFVHRFYIEVFERGDTRPCAFEGDSG